VFFALFVISERINARKKAHEAKGLEQFNLDHQPQIDSTSLHARPGCILVAIRDYSAMDHFKQVLRKTTSAVMTSWS